MRGRSQAGAVAPVRTERWDCARSPCPHVSLSVMPRPGAMHRAAVPSCTPAPGTAMDRSSATFTGVRPPPGTAVYSMVRAASASRRQEPGHPGAPS